MHQGLWKENFLKSTIVTEKLKRTPVSNLQSRSLNKREAKAGTTDSRLIGEAACQSGTLVTGHSDDQLRCLTHASSHPLHFRREFQVTLLTPRPLILTRETSWKTAVSWRRFSIR